MTFKPTRHGQYEWQVTAFQSGSNQKSTVQTLTFIEAAGPDRAIAAFISNVSARKPGTFLVNDVDPAK